MTKEDVSRRVCDDGGGIIKPKPVEWVYIIAGLFLTYRYLWFLDDCGIYYRYVDNLLFLKIGLVYNYGEFVEGFTSPLWVVMLTVFRYFHVSYWYIVEWMAYACFIGFALIIVKVNRRMSPEGGVVNFPLAYLAVNYGVLSYFSSGLESPLVQVAAAAYALYILNPSSALMQAVIALSPLIRPELALPMVLCAIWGGIRERRVPVRLLLMILVFNGMWLTFRIWYYADLFPNIFYLKNEDNPTQGMTYLFDTLSTYHFLTVFAAFAILTVLLARRNIDVELRARVMMLVTSLAVMLYIVKIGGDYMHFRMLSFPFILSACAFSGILEKTRENLLPQLDERIVSLIGVLILATSFTYYPSHILDKHPAYVDGVNGVIYKSVDDANNFRRLKHLYEETFFILQPHRKMIEYQRKFPEFRYSWTDTSLYCLEYYIKFDIRLVQWFGLTDPFLARMKVQTPRPGHRDLGSYAQQITEIKRASGDDIYEGMFLKAVIENRAPRWVVKNLDRIMIIEKKAYNKHDFAENLKLAFTFPGAIVVEEA
ncbi:MAG: hypothetical protein ABIH11_05715 [Candidatus Altiarchaeota archaeon]